VLREPQALLPDFQFLQDAFVGEPEICITVLDRSVNLSHPCFRGGGRPQAYHDFSERSCGLWAHVNSRYGRRQRDLR